MPVTPTWYREPRHMHIQNYENCSNSVAYLGQKGPKDVNFE